MAITDIAINMAIADTTIADMAIADIAITEYSNRRYSNRRYSHYHTGIVLADVGSQGLAEASAESVMTASVTTGSSRHTGLAM